MQQIEVCGGIATGKTTFASLVSRNTSFVMAKEDYQAVPFLTNFYTDPSKYGLAKNLSFLLAHAGSIHSLKNEQPKNIICDFAFFQDVAYSKLGDARESALVEKLYDHLQEVLGYPTLVVRLECNAETQLSRIQSRGRTFEGNISKYYLENLDAEIDRYLKTKIRARKIPAITINTDEIDLINNPKAAYENLRKLIPVISSNEAANHEQ